MYMSKMLSIGKAENGFVVECNVPIKPEKKKDAEKMLCGMSREKQFIAKDASEVGKLIEKLMPMLDEEYTTEKEFDAAFADHMKPMKEMKR